MTLHFWFDSGKYKLLAHAELPTAAGGLGVVIVPAFGWEDVCSYRPLRLVAKMLADRGIPVLRYDLPATGDSSGNPLDANLIDAWIESVGNAAAELRAISGVKSVAVFGIRLGGMLAAAAADRGADVQDLILWGSAASGRSEMRELRAYANMERWEFGDNAASTATEDGFEVGGFLLSPETQRDLESLDTAKLANLGGRRVLLLSRDDVAPDAKLVQAFESAGCETRVGKGAGYAAMMAAPHEALCPDATAQTLAEFLAAPQRIRSIRAQLSAQSISAEPGVSEKILPIDSGMFAIHCESSRPPRSESCVLYLNAGGVRHIGPNRMWVQSARSAALAGLSSVRIDLPGIGESEGEEFLDIPALYQEHLVHQVHRSIDALRSRFGYTSFALVGLCAGAFWAFHAALSNPEVASAILLNPRLFFWDPEVDRRRMVRRGARGLVSFKDWRRLFQGGVQRADLKRAARLLLSKSRDSLFGSFSQRQIPPVRMAEAWRALDRNRTRVALIFTEGEPLLDEMERERQMPPRDNPSISVVRVPPCGHTFRPRWSQKIVNDLIHRELESVVRRAPANHVSKVP